jgi:hypothetical protein
LVAKVLRTRENHKTAKRLWKKLGRQIRGFLKPETLKRSRLVKIEVQDGDGCRKVEYKEIVEEHLTEQNIEQFSLARKNQFGYSDLGAKLVHTGHVAEKMFINRSNQGNFEPAKGASNSTTNNETNHDAGIFHIVLQVRTRRNSIIILSPISTKLQSMRKNKGEGKGELLTLVYALTMTVPLDVGSCPDRWRKAVDVMLEKLRGVLLTNKLCITQLLEA